LIKYSYYNRNLTELKKQYGPGNVFVSKKNDAVMVRNFVPPLYYRMDETWVYLDIPQGFGYGINISNSYVLLNKKMGRSHLYQSDQLFPEIADSFNISFQKKEIKGKEWFWICFHMWGDKLFDNNTGRTTYNPDVNPEFHMVGFAEYLNMVRVALTLISREDPFFLSELEKMNSEMDNILAERERLIKDFSLSHNWRNLKWVY